MKPNHIKFVEMISQRKRIEIAMFCVIGNRLHPGSGGCYKTSNLDVKPLHFFRCNSARSTCTSVKKLVPTTTRIYFVYMYLLIIINLNVVLIISISVISTYLENIMHFIHDLFFHSTYFDELKKYVVAALASYCHDPYMERDFMLIRQSCIHASYFD